MMEDGEKKSQAELLEASNPTAEAAADQDQEGDRSQEGQEALASELQEKIIQALLPKAEDFDFYQRLNSYYKQLIEYHGLVWGEISQLPLIAMSAYVALPKSSCSFQLQSPAARLAAQAALQASGLVLLCPCRGEEVGDGQATSSKARAEDLHSVACLAQVHDCIACEGGETWQLRATGLYRMRIVDVELHEGYFRAQTIPMEESLADEDSFALEAARRLILRRHREYMELLHSGLENWTDLLEDSGIYDLVYAIAGTLNLNYNENLSLLIERRLLDRYYVLLRHIERESRIAARIAAVDEELSERIREDQQAYYMREKIRMLQEELGDEERPETERERYEKQLAALDMPESSREQLMKEVAKLKNYPPHMPEAVNLRSYLDYVFDLPWGKLVEENLDLRHARKCLNADHYGLERVKERLLEYLALRKRQQRQEGTPNKAPILCLVGPPGVGKTSIAATVARAIGRPYIRMSLGGVHDEADVRGHRRTYLGALPGRFLQAMRQAKCDNPLILLDEIDKLGRDFRGDPASALLEVLDPEQNKAFQDHYLELPYDLSKVLFITTANRREDIPEALLDRMECMDLEAYTEEEKFHILRRHLWPRQAAIHVLDTKRIKLHKSALLGLIRDYTREAGLRALEQELARLCRRLALEEEQASKEAETGHKLGPRSLHYKDLQTYLGRPRYHYEASDFIDRVGQVTGLAWTAVGGETLTIECALIPGKGRIEMTGSLGSVMKESVKVALAYIRSHPELTPELDSSEFFETHDVHIHVPQGAVPKDGPSAGVTMTTAICSALTRRPVRSTVAMTGETTIRGRVLAIGGLKEKLIAALRLGIKEVYIPKDNERDLDELPKTVLDQLKIHPVAEVSELLEGTLLPATEGA